MNHARPVLDPERVATHTLPVTVPSSHDEAQTLAQQVAYLLSAEHRVLPEAQSVLARALESLR